MLTMDAFDSWMDYELVSILPVCFTSHSRFRSVRRHKYVAV